MKKGWKKINDSKVVTVWKSICNCPDSVAQVELYTCDIADTGIPTCSDCGADFEYEETRIKIK